MPEFVSSATPRVLSSRTGQNLQGHWKNLIAGNNHDHAAGCPRQARGLAEPVSRGPARPTAAFRGFNTAICSTPPLRTAAGGLAPPLVRLCLHPQRTGGWSANVGRLASGRHKHCMDRLLRSWVVREGLAAAHQVPHSRPARRRRDSAVADGSATRAAFAARPTTGRHNAQKWPSLHRSDSLVVSVHTKPRQSLANAPVAAASYLLQGSLIRTAWWKTITVPRTAWP